AIHCRNHETARAPCRVGGTTPHACCVERREQADVAAWLLDRISDAVVALVVGPGRAELVQAAVHDPGVVARPATATRQTGSDPPRGSPRPASPRPHSPQRLRRGSAATASP